MRTAKGLLLALSAPPDGGEDEYNAWYDEEHAPARLTVPGIRTGRRYRETTTGNDYLAYYDLDSTEVLASPEYEALAGNASDRERRILPVVMPDRRVYQEVITPEVSRAGDWNICGDVLLAVWWTPAPGTEEDFNAWYTEEHIPLLMKVPGWLRVRRYSLVSGNGAHYLALHDLSSEAALQEPSHAVAGQTPWRDRVTASRREYKRLLFRLWRRFDRLA